MGWMNILYLIIILSFAFPFQLQAEKVTLPDGQDVDATHVRRHGKGKIQLAKLINLTMIDTSVGKLKFKGTIYFNIP